MRIKEWNPDATLALVVSAIICLALASARELPGQVREPRVKPDTVLPDTRDHELIGWGGEQERPTSVTRTFAATAKQQMQIEFVSWQNPYMCARGAAQSPLAAGASPSSSPLRGTWLTGRSHPAAPCTPRPASSTCTTSSRTRSATTSSASSRTPSSGHRWSTSATPAPKLTTSAR